MSIFKKDSVENVCSDLVSRLEQIERAQQQAVDKANAEIHAATERLQAARAEQHRADRAITKIRELFA